MASSNRLQPLLQPLRSEDSGSWVVTEEPVTFCQFPLRPIAGMRVAVLAVASAVSGGQRFAASSALARGGARRAGGMRERDGLVANIAGSRLPPQCLSTDSVA